MGYFFGCSLGYVSNGPQFNVTAFLANYTGATWYYDDVNYILYYYDYADCMWYIALNNVIINMPAGES